MTGPGTGHTGLNIQIDDFEGVILDEFAARLDVFAHQGRENVFGRDGIFQFDLKQGAGIRIHRGFPQLLRVHFAQALESGDGEIFLRVFDDVVQDVDDLFLGDFVAVAGDDERGRLNSSICLARPRSFL